MNLQDNTIAIISLGYVGLPLAVEFGKVRPVIGFDINPQRIAELQGGKDHMLECSPEELSQASHLRYSCAPADLQQAQVGGHCTPPSAQPSLQCGGVRVRHPQATVWLGSRQPCVTWGIGNRGTRIP